MGDHSLSCGKSGGRIARQNMLRDVIFETASSVDLGPIREERHLLPGTIARPGDVWWKGWSNWRDCHQPAGQLQRCWCWSPSRCFSGKGMPEEGGRHCWCLPTWGPRLPPLCDGNIGWVAFTQVKLLASYLARSKGSDEREATSQLFGRLSLNLMRGNALMLSSRCQDGDIPLAEVDGVWNIPKCITFHD